MDASIPKSEFPRVVIVGAGFAGLMLARKLAKKQRQVVLLDRHNYHQFQPLFYQVATSGIAPSAIAFPIRKLFHKEKHVHFRMTEVLEIDCEQHKVQTAHGELHYDQLVIATGADTNYFNNVEIQRNALPMKSIGESLQLRNQLLSCMEQAILETDEKKRDELLHVCIVGAGPTGVELAGALSEMRDRVLPKDYPEIDFSKMEISLMEAGDRVLPTMSTQSSTASLKFLEGMGINVKLNTHVERYDGRQLVTASGETMTCKTLIWAAGVTGNLINGLPLECYTRRGQIRTNAYSAVIGAKDIWAVGDIADMEVEGISKRWPQVAQVAIQQAKLLASNILKSSDEDRAPFEYKDLGSMATIGRSKAVADLPGIHMHGFFAWVFWLFVHLMNILGVKNKFFVFVDWTWYYLTFDQSLRLLITKKGSDEHQSLPKA